MFGLHGTDLFWGLSPFGNVPCPSHAYELLSDEPGARLGLSLSHFEGQLISAFS